jgi:hypothetical protein
MMLPGRFLGGGIKQRYCQLNVQRPKWDIFAERGPRLLRTYHFLPNPSSIDNTVLTLTTSRRVSDLSTISGIDQFWEAVSPWAGTTRNSFRVVSESLSRMPPNPSQSRQHPL